MTRRHTSELEGAPQGAPSDVPVLLGWTIDEDLVLDRGEWRMVWHLFFQMPSGDIHEVVLHDDVPGL